MASNTARNIGYRINCGALGERNFEPDGLTLYRSHRANLGFGDELYQIGEVIPFDNQDGSAYKPESVAILKRYWEMNSILPVK